MTRLPALLLLAACSTAEKAPRPSGIDTTPSVPAESPRFAMAHGAVDSVKASRSIKRVDTSWVDTVRTYATIRVPVAPTVLSGTPFLGYECTAATLKPYTTCVRAAGSWSANDLAAMKAVGGTLMLNQGGYGKFQNCSVGHTAAEIAVLCDKKKTPTADRRYNPAQYKAWVYALAPYAQSWQPFIADGTLIGAQVIDDIGTGTWDVAITKGQQDTMAMWWKEVVPGITTFTREKATGLTGYDWKYLDASLTSYNGRYMGDIRLWRDSNVVAAKQAKLSLMLGVNLLDGGKLVPGCYHGADPRYCAMTPEELYTWGMIQLSTPGICGWVTWKLDAAYQSRPGIAPALQTLAAMAARLPAPPCRRPS